MEAVLSTPLLFVIGERLHSNQVPVTVETTKLDWRAPAKGQIEVPGVLWRSPQRMSDQLSRSAGAL